MMQILLGILSVGLQLWEGICPPNQVNATDKAQDRVDALTVKWVMVASTVGAITMLGYWVATTDAKHPITNFQVLGFAMVCAGLGIRWWAQRALGRFFTYTIAVRQQHKLVTTGPYRWLRHPAYTGTVIMIAGNCLFFQSPLLTLLTVLSVAWLYWWRLPREEAMLHRHFGADWEQFAASRWRLVPGW